MCSSVIVLLIDKGSARVALQRKRIYNFADVIKKSEMLIICSVSVEYMKRVKPSHTRGLMASSCSGDL